MLNRLTIGALFALLVAGPLIAQVTPVGGGTVLTNSVNSAAIADGSVVNDDVNASAAIAYSKMANVAGLSVLGVTGSASASAAAITASADGEVLRRISSTSLAFSTIGVQNCVVSTSTQSATSDTTEDNDDTLLFPVVATGTYQFEGTVFFTSGTDVDPDVKLTFALPASAAYTYGADGFAVGATTVAGGHHSWGSTTSGVGTGLSFGVISTAQSAQSPVWYSGTVVTAGTSGSVTLMWSQNTSDTTPLVRGVRSNICWTRIN